jgi:hypothetical protein
MVCSWQVNPCPTCPRTVAIHLPPKKKLPRDKGDKVTNSSSGGAVDHYLFFPKNIRIPENNFQLRQMMIR